MGDTYNTFFRDKINAISDVEMLITARPDDPYLLRGYVNASNKLLLAVVGVVERLADAKEDDGKQSTQPTIHELQQTIGKWAAKKFPKSTSDSTMRHLWMEMVELDRAVSKNDSVRVCDEVADLFILLTQLCNLYQINLEAVVLEKHKANMTREWQEPDAHGVVYHKKE
jgi:NTP pyrophosphatase (non-canonical NTP hydrolase)